MARPGSTKVRGHGTDEPAFWVSNERLIVYTTKVPNIGIRIIRKLREWI
jgi:hypothetical protein